MTRVVVAMSGGVDSSVAALRLRETGAELVGLFLRNGVVHREAADCGPLPLLAPAHKQGCCSVDDARDARAVAAVLGIPFHAVDFSGEFESIIDGFVDSYRKGRTPNPCVECNRDLKFGALLRFADSIGADAVATGHYARSRPGGPLLARSADRAKDQSYVLAAVDRHGLSRAMFPLGDLTKDQTRELARRAGLPTASKRESQEICFVPSNDYRDLLAERGVVGTPGPLVHADGRQLGTHDGYEKFTVGQRKGIGIAAPEALYVISIDASTATVTVGPRAALATHVLRCGALSWLGPEHEAPSQGEAREYWVQIRAHHTPVRCTAAPTDSGLRIELLAPEPGVAAGQLAVLYDGYDGELVAGSAWIESAE